MVDLASVNYCLSFVPAGKVMSDSEAAESQHDMVDESAGPGNTESIGKTNPQINKNIRTLAEAIQALRSDVSELKRKANVDPSTLTGQSAEKRARALENAPESSPQSKGQDRERSCVSPIPGTSTDNLNTVESDGENIDGFMAESDNESIDDEIDDTLEDLECFFGGQDETGPDVSERMAKITDQALRGAKTKGDDDKLKELAKSHKRPKNIINMQVPKVDDLLWRQLKRETKTIDFIQQKATANYNLIMTPLIKALDLFKQKDQQKTAIGFVTDAYKMLGLTVKQTTHARRERIRKELQPQFRSICEQEASPKHLFGENLAEAIKKLQGTKTLTTTHSQGNFLSRKGAPGKNQHYKYHKGAPQFNRFNRTPQTSFKKKQPQNNQNRK